MLTTKVDQTKTTTLQKSLQKWYFQELKSPPHNKKIVLSFRGFAPSDYIDTRKPAFFFIRTKRNHKKKLMIALNHSKTVNFKSKNRNTDFENGEDPNIPHFYAKDQMSQQQRILYFT